MKFFVYVVRCRDGTFYTGYTTDIEKRIAVHNGEGGTASDRSARAKYTSGRRPVKLVYSESFKTRSGAMKREYAIKQLRRKEKLALINQK